MRIQYPSLTSDVWRSLPDDPSIRFSAPSDSDSGGEAFLTAKASAAALSQPILAVGQQQAIDVQEGKPRVESVADGAAALRFDAPSQLRLDLKPKGLEAKNFDARHWPLVSFGYSSQHGVHGP